MGDGNLRRDQRNRRINLDRRADETDLERLRQHADWLYTVEPTGRLEVTDLVAVDAPNRSPASWRTVDICRAGHRC